jgi:tRNA(adenine34) deaminase
MSEPRPPSRICPFEKLHPSLLTLDDEYFMKLAYNQAIEAWRVDETPIGAVIEIGGEVIAQAHNLVENSGDPTAHAEILALTQAANVVGDWRLNGARLFVTKEPCPMCSGASIMARLREVAYGVGDPKMGCLGGATALHELPKLNHHLKARGGILGKECLELLTAYFAEKRLEGD